MNAISELNEQCQKLYGRGLRYAVTRSKTDPGSDHCPNFDATVVLPGGRQFKSLAQRGSKRQAKLSVAKSALAALNAERTQAQQQPEPSPEDTMPAAAAVLPPTADYHEVTSTVCMARVMSRTANGVVASPLHARGRIRICGDIADDLHCGQLLQIQAKQIVAVVQHSSPPSPLPPNKQ